MDKHGVHIHIEARSPGTSHSHFIAHKYELNGCYAGMVIGKIPPQHIVCNKWLNDIDKTK